MVNQGTVKSIMHPFSTDLRFLIRKYVSIYSLQYNRVELPRSYDRVDVTPKFVDVSKLYVHKNYSNSSHDFDISILKLESVLKFHPEDIYPAILPLSRLDHGNQLHVAMTKGLSEHYFERKNVSIWSKDECAPNEEHLMCIETDGDCDDLVKI